MVNVSRLAGGRWRAASASTTLESIPPERKIAQRHVADQAPRHRAIQQRAQFLGQFRNALVGRVLVGLDGEPPVALLPHAEIGQIERERTSAGQFAGAAIERVGRGDIAIGEEFLQRARIDRAVDRGMADQRGQLRGERRRSRAETA